MRKSFTVKYDYGESVCLKTKPSEIRVICGFIIRQKSVEYLLKQGDEEFCHREVEIEKVRRQRIIKRSSGEFVVKGFKLGKSKPGFK